MYNDDDLFIEIYNSSQMRLLRNFTECAEMLKTIFKNPTPVQRDANVNKSPS